jgi:hypothetical protein
MLHKVPIPIAKNHVLMSLVEAALQNGAAGTIDSGGYGSGDDDEIVLRGIRVLGSSAGTYTVRKENGLQVYDQKPSKGSTTVEITGRCLRTLKYGQTVQIARFENNIATIARGAGYIPTETSSELVKGMLADMDYSIPTVR